MSTIEVTSPFDGRVVGTVPFTTVEVPVALVEIP